ncbi:MAG: hypothetical protein ABL999_17360 [Pyrinomonadaceae bacterium]
MKRLIGIFFLTIAGASFGLAQGTNKELQRAIADAKKVAIDELRDAKQNARTQEVNVLTPADFNDQDSFGKDVMFLGSLYAGTVFIAPTCNVPDVPPNLAPDDKCITKALNQNLPSTVYSDPAWQITIPGKTAKNVIYLLLNNTVQHDNGFAAGNFLGGQGFMSYGPVVTIVSEALNDPAALDPGTGLPMNGSFTTGLPGSKFRTKIYTAGQFEQEIDSYASVNGRGLSRVFFKSIGLPESVVDKIYKKDLTLKFGIRVAQFGAVASGTYSYTFRVIGQ